MSITIKIGKAGRLVVPKSIRDNLGLHEGSLLKLDIQGGKLQVAPQPGPVQIDIEDGLPIIRAGSLLKRERITKAIKEDRDARDARLSSSSNSQ